MVWWPSCSQEAHPGAEEKCRHPGVMLWPSSCPASQASSPVLLSLVGHQQLQKVQRSAGAGRAEGTPAAVRSGSTAAADLKLYNHGRFLYVEVSLQTRDEDSPPATSQLLYLGWSRQNGELGREKGAGLIQPVLRGVCRSSLLQLHTSSHTSSLLTKANLLQRYLIPFIKNKVNEGSKIRYFKRHVIVPFRCHNKERYFKSTLLNWIQISAALPAEGSTPPCLSLQAGLLQSALHHGYTWPSLSNQLNFIESIDDYYGNELNSYCL